MAVPAANTLSQPPPAFTTNGLAVASCWGGNGSETGEGGMEGRQQRRVLTEMIFEQRTLDPWMSTNGDSLWLGREGSTLVTRGVDEWSVGLGVHS